MVGLNEATMSMVDFIDCVVLRMGGVCCFFEFPFLVLILPWISLCTTHVLSYAPVHRHY